MQSIQPPMIAAYKGEHFKHAPPIVQIRIRWILRRAVLRNIEECNRWINSPEGSRFIYQGA